MTKVTPTSPSKIAIFTIPVIVLLCIGLSLFFQHVVVVPLLAFAVLGMGIVVGSLRLIKDTLTSIKEKNFALDYIAILAILVGVLSGEYIVAAVIVLMLSGGHALEDYSLTKAKQSLTALTDRIPDEVILYENDDLGKKVSLSSVTVGQKIAIRKGEVIPLDGVLDSKIGLIDESSLTGEPVSIEKRSGDTVRSGTINVGELMVITVTKVDKDSTYHKIIEMVKNAQEQKSPFIRLADKYSSVFTVVTLVIAALAYLIFRDFDRVLSVLVIATPCPLILATPIALIGGMNSAAKRRIIMKNLSSIEVLSRVTTIVFDKTGTITMGRPTVSQIIRKDDSYSEKKIVEIAASLERNSLHPFAKAILSYAKKHDILHHAVSGAHEIIGQGIEGKIDNVNYELTKLKGHPKMAIQLLKGKIQLAIFEFEDVIKDSSKKIISHLKQKKLHLYIFTGDKKETAEELVTELGGAIHIRADQSPEDKKNGIEELKKKGYTVAMVGDGINDAPALALSDVGMVFSNEEHTAASEAADIVFLGGNLAAVTTSIMIGKRTIDVATQSILFGIGLSTVGMLFALFGFIPPVTGAFIQEAIDVAVILNALRASR